MAKLIGTGRPRLWHRVLAHLEAGVPSAGPFVGSATGRPRIDGAGTGTGEKDRRRTGNSAVGTWRWLLADATGVAVAGPAVCFTSGEVAQDWLSAASGRLAALGVTAVTLFDGERVVYGPEPLPLAGLEQM